MSQKHLAPLGIKAVFGTRDRQDVFSDGVSAVMTAAIHGFTAGDVFCRRRVLRA